MYDKKPSGPYSISAHGFTYHHIEDTESFHMGDPEYPLTALKVMKAILPDIVRKKYRRITPPPEFFMFGDSTRFKIIKAVQAHYDKPEPSAETDNFIKFFQVLSDNVQDHWTVQQQYSAAKWASGYDESAASALLLHYGWSPRHEPRMLGSSMHTIKIKEEGILLDMTYTHTFQERCDAACSEAQLIVDDMKRRGAPLIMEDVRSAAFRTFYYYKEKYISLNNEYAMGVKSKMQSYIDSLLNVLEQETPIVPSIGEPEDLLENTGVVFMPWEAFEFVDNYYITSAAHQQRQDNNKQAAYEAFLQKTKHIPQGIPIKKKDLPPNIEGKQLKAWKDFGFIQSPKYGFYLIPISDEGDEN